MPPCSWHRSAVAGHNEYAIDIAPRAKRELAKLPRDAQRRIARSIYRLALERRPRGAKLLSGMAERIWRLRVGDLPVLYEVYDDRLVVLVVRVAHRGEAYR
ncbi:MAG: type II toxin-antitoxin system RelE/ParE family toxin [Chloroflexota bacterium]